MKYSLKDAPSSAIAIATCAASQASEAWAQRLIPPAPMVVARSSSEMAVASEVFLQMTVPSGKCLSSSSSNRAPELSMFYPWAVFHDEIKLLEYQANHAY